MASVIKIKRSTTPGSAPSSLAAGEIAVNIPDRLIFVGDGSTIYRVGAQYLSVANASATYTTKAYAAANSYVKSVLANTNSYIATRASWTALTGTNTALRTLISDRYQVANVNTLLAAKATWTALTGTNTALRTLISDRLQVANAAATYQTKAVERAALANTNSYIATKSSWTALTGTNTALRTLINDRYQVANVNTLLAAKATWAGLTGTNTALRTLINDRLQVANAAATYQTKAVERAALANTNARINLLNTNLTGTNTSLRTLINDRLQVSNASSTYATKSNPTTSGLLAHTGRATISTNLAVTGNTTIGGLIANNTLGSAGYYLRTSGTGVYWSPIAAQTQYLQVSNAVATYATKSNPTTSGLLAHTGRMTISTNLAVSGNTRITGSTIIDGDLTVEGGVTYISSSTLNVDDSMIKLAANNASDAVDVGFYGKYVAAATTKYAGIFRDASDGVFKVYIDSQTEPGTTVNVAAVGYSLGTLDAVIDGGTY